MEKERAPGSAIANIKMTRKYTIDVTIAHRAASKAREITCFIQLSPYNSNINL